VIFVRMLAVADVHSPRYLNLFIASLSQIATSSIEIDVVVLAGDMVDRGRIEYLKPVLEAIHKNICRDRYVPIMAVFGNEEYFDKEEEIVRKFPDVIWLNDNFEELEVKGAKICFVGSRGVLQKPTRWQQKHIPNIAEMYRERVTKLKELLRVCRARCDKVILVTHYAPTFQTVKGEPPAIYGYLGYPLLEQCAQYERPDIAIHGHAHNSKVLRAVVNGVEVYNVSLPAKGGVTVIEMALDLIQRTY